MIFFRNFCLFFLIIVSCSNLYSQEKAIYNAVHNSEGSGANSLFTDWMINFQYGITRFKGDLNQYNYYPAYQESIKFYELKKAYSIAVIRNFPPFFRLSTQYNRGKLAGIKRAISDDDILFLDNLDDPYEAYNNDGQKFLTEFNQVSLLFKTNIKAAYSYFSKSKIPKSIRQINQGNIELDFGLGYNMFHSQRSNLYTEEYIYSYGYELINIPDEINQQSVFLQEKQVVLIYGISSEYLLNEKMNIVFSYHVTHGTNDKWDSAVVDSNNRYDKYTFLSLGLSYRLE